MQNFYKSVLDNLYDGVYFVDRDRRITYWNKGAERISGYAAEEVTGRSCRDGLLNHVNEEGCLLCTDACPLAASMDDGKPREAEVFLHHAGGHRIPVLVRSSPMRDDDGKIIGAVEIFSCNAALLATRRRAHTLENLTLTDPLTGVGSRRHLDVRLKSTLLEYREQQIPFGLLFIDVDHFKQVNDRYGHEAGDKVLRMVALTLRGNLRTGDDVGRWGGEEFVCILQDIQPEMLPRIAEKQRSLIACSRLDLQDGSIAVTVSVGATIVRPEDELPSLIHRADQLMYSSKSEGRNRTTIG